MKNQELKRIILEKSEGVLSTLTDLVLTVIFFNLELVGSGPKGASTVNLLAEKVFTDLEEINYRTIKRTLLNLKNKGLVEVQGRNLGLTKEGQEKIKKIFLVSSSKERRAGEVYLVIYDIADVSKSNRDLLRRFLLTNRMVRLQESVYLSVLNPHLLLEDFFRLKSINGQVLVAKLGKDGMIGGESIKSFIGKAFDLKKLEEMYLEFINYFSDLSLHQIFLLQLNFAFNKIYREDPHLPEEFLPKDWVGYKAFRLYQDLKKVLKK